MSWDARLQVLLLGAGVVIVLYLIQLYNQKGASVEQIRSRNLWVKRFFWWVVGFSVISAINLGDRFSAWGWWRLFVFGLGCVIIIPGLSQADSPNLIVQRIFGKWWRFVEEGWYYRFWFLGETPMTVPGGEERSSTIRRDEYNQAVENGDKNIKEPDLTEELASPWTPSRAALVGGKLVDTENATGSPLRGHFDPTWLVVQAITFARLGMTFLREKVGGFKNPLDTLMGRYIKALPYNYVLALQGRNNILMFAKFEHFCSQMRAASKDGRDPEEAMDAYEAAYTQVPKDLQDAVNGRDREEIFRLVLFHFLGTMQAMYVTKYGIYMNPQLELVEEHPDVLKARNEALQAGIDVSKQVQEALGEGQKRGLTVKEAVKAALGDRPHEGRNYADLSPAEQAQQDRWDNAVAEGLSAEYDNKRFASTASTVFTTRRDRVRPNVNIPLGAAKHVPAPTPPADAGDATGAP